MGSLRGVTGKSVGLAPTKNTALHGRDPIDYKRHTHRSAGSHKPQSPIEAQPIVQHTLRRQPRVAAGYNHCKALQPSACIPIASTLNLQSAATGVRSFATASLLFHRLLSLQSLLFQPPPNKTSPPPVGDPPFSARLGFRLWHLVSVLAA